MNVIWTRTVRSNKVAHSLICGMTESGKSTLAKRMCSEFRKQGIGVLVYAPIDKRGWDCDFLTDDLNHFKAVVLASRKCMVFIDEADTVCSRSQPENNWLAVRSRHRQHSVFFITQRPQMINTTVRGQCKNLFLFSIALDDAKDLARQWNCNPLKSVANFQTGEYIFAPKMGKASKSSLFTWYHWGYSFFHFHRITHTVGRG